MKNSSTTAVIDAQGEAPELDETTTQPGDRPVGEPGEPGTAATEAPDAEPDGQAAHVDAIDAAGAELVATATAPARDVAHYDPDAGTITIATGIPNHFLTFTRGQRVLNEEQMHLLSPLGIEAGWDPAQVAVFLMQARARDLNPWAKEAYLLLLGGKYVNHTGIGGFRRLAEETGLYAGKIGPQWCGPDGQWLDVWLKRDEAPYAARCGILRKDRETPDWAVAYYDEYAPLIDETVWNDQQRRKVKTGKRVYAAKWKLGKDGGSANLMIAKCAEAAAFRAAFPKKFGGFYESAETDRMRAEAFETDKPEQTPAATEAAARRKAAYQAAHQDAEQATAAAETRPMFEQLGYGDVVAKALLLAELQEHGVIVGKTREEMTARWSAARGGAPITAWPLGDVAKFMLGVREIVAQHLRALARDDEAAALLQAPPVGPVTVVFGRRAVVIDEDTADAPAGDEA
jgi:phage recombination protein Bet